MSLLLLVTVTLSVCHGLHQSLHGSKALESHICLVCSLAKGQAAGPDAPLISVPAPLPNLFYTRPDVDAALPGGIDYSFSYGRGPPIC